MKNYQKLRKLNQQRKRKKNLMIKLMKKLRTQLIRKQKRTKMIMMTIKMTRMNLMEMIVNLMMIRMM